MSSKQSPVSEPAHVLYISGARPSDQPTIAALRYVAGKLPVFAKMGVRVEVQELSRAHLANKGVVAALKARGASSLPALVTPVGTYVGFTAIKDVYERNIAAFARAKPAIEPDDDITSYLKTAIAKPDADVDSDDIVESGGDDLSASYRKMMEVREGRKGPATSPAGRKEPAARPGNLRDFEERGDNLSGLDASDLIKAIASGKGAQLIQDDEAPTSGEDSAKDDIMLKAYWSNQQASD